MASNEMPEEDLPAGMARRSDLPDRGYSSGDIRSTGAFRQRMPEQVGRAVRWAWREIALGFLAAFIAGVGAGVAQALISRI